MNITQPLQENPEHKISCYDCIYFGGYIWQEDKYWCRYNYSDKTDDLTCDSFIDTEYVRHYIEASRNTYGK